MLQTIKNHLLREEQTQYESHISANVSEHGKLQRVAEEEWMAGQRFSYMK